MNKSIVSVMLVFIFLLYVDLGFAQTSTVGHSEETTPPERTLARFSEKIMWIQVGNQIKDLDDSLYTLLKDTGFSKIVLLHSSVNEHGYFPKLSKIVKKAHALDIKIAVGTLVFKDTFQKRYWEKHPSLRHCSKDGSHTDHKFYHYQICPNNPQNHEYISSLLIRKASNSHADEIHIDYEISPCYCEYCVTSFKTKTGLDPRSLSDKDPVWMAWRSKRTRDFFELLARKARSLEPPLAISVTAPVIGHKTGFTAYETDLLYEDLTMYTDEFTPMIYLSIKQEAALAGEHFARIESRIKGKKIFPGIIINEEFTPVIKTSERVADEIWHLQQKNAGGIAVFEIRYLNDDLRNLFKQI